MENSTERLNSEEEPVLIDLHEKLSIDSSDSPILNRMVRKAYFQYIKKMLQNNASHTKTFISETDINKYAQEIELNALKICMSSVVYRYVMLNEINNIKCMTYGKIPFFEKELLDPKQVSESGEILNLYFKHYASHSENNDHVSLWTKRNHMSNNAGELSTDQTTLGGRICDHNMKTERMSVEDNTSQCPEQESALHILNREIKKENSDDNDTFNSYVKEPNKNQDSVYDKVYQEMTQMFAPETNNSLNVQASPTSIISTDRYFTHKDQNFWYLEHEIKKAQYQQITSTIYELNEQKYEMVVENVKKIFEQEGSPTIENSPIALRKITYICKERITWHVKKSLSLYYKKKQFRSVDEFRILAKSIVSRFLQIDPYIDYKHIHKAISKVFDRKEKMYVQNISQIQSIVSKVSQYAVYMIKKSK